MFQITFHAYHKIWHPLITRLCKPLKQRKTLTVQRDKLLHNMIKESSLLIYKTM